MDSKEKITDDFNALLKTLGIGKSRSNVRFTVDNNGDDLVIVVDPAKAHNELSADKGINELKQKLENSGINVKGESREIQHPYYEEDKRIEIISKLTIVLPNTPESVDSIININQQILEDRKAKAAEWTAEEDKRKAEIKPFKEALHKLSATQLFYSENDRHISVNKSGDDMVISIDPAVATRRAYLKSSIEDRIGKIKQALEDSGIVVEVKQQTLPPVYYRHKTGSENAPELIFTVPNTQDSVAKIEDAYARLLTNKGTEVMQKVSKLLEPLGEDDRTKALGNIIERVSPDTLKVYNVKSGTKEQGK